MNKVNEDKLSPWFPHETKPVLPGVYEVLLVAHDGGLIQQGFSSWDGQQWSNTCSTILDAVNRESEGANQDKPWRGVKPEHLKYQVVYPEGKGLYWTAREDCVGHAIDKPAIALNTFWKE